MRKSAIVIATLLLMVGITSCDKNKKQTEQAQTNAAVLASLGDIMQGDYNDVISRIDGSGRFSRDDIFGNNHEFTSKERALNYIASVNNATFFVMDSLQLTIEAAAVASPDNQMLGKLNKLAKKYITVCKHPADSPEQLIETCKSISEAIKTTVKSMGKTDDEAIAKQTALAGNAIMHKEMDAAKKATEENSAAAENNKIEGEKFLKYIRPEIIQLAKSDRNYWLSKRCKVLDAAQDFIFDLYLRGNHVAEGRKSYSGVVGLILAWESRHAK